MNKFIVVVFPDAKKAYEGMKTLNELDDEGSITLYGTAVVERNRDGTISTKEKKPDAPVAAGLGALLGGLVGALGGPAGVAVGLGSGTALGGAYDLFSLGVSNEFVESVASTLSPGKTAIVAEVSEEWVTPVDTRMEALGGNVIRATRDDFVEDEVQKRIASHKADFEQRRAERAAAKADKSASKLQKDVDSAKQKLRQMADKARARVEEYKGEFDAKIDKLRDQASHATPEAKARIEERIAAMRTHEQQRLTKLEQAWKTTQDALRS